MSLQGLPVIRWAYFIYLTGLEVWKLKCIISGCASRAVVTEEVIIRGKRMMLAVCTEHYKLIVDLKEEKALRREQAAERLRWGGSAKGHPITRRPKQGSNDPCLPGMSSRH